MLYVLAPNPLLSCCPFTSPFVIPLPCSQRAVYSKTASRASRRETWLNPEKEPSKTATPHYNIALCLKDEELLYKCTIAILSRKLHLYLFISDSRENTSSSMWRRGLSRLLHKDWWAKTGLIQWLALLGMSCWRSPSGPLLALANKPEIKTQSILNQLVCSPLPLW